MVISRGGKKSKSHLNFSLHSKLYSRSNDSLNVTNKTKFKRKKNKLKENSLMIVAKKMISQMKQKQKQKYFKRLKNITLLSY